MMRSARGHVMGLVLVIAAWWLVVCAGVIHRVLLPDPWTTAVEAIRLFHGPIRPDLVATLARCGAGFAIAFALGVPAGLWIGLHREVRRVTELPLDLFRSLPAVALMPLFVVLLGIGEVTKITVVVCAVTPILAINTAYGVRTTSDARTRLARVLGMRAMQRVRLIVVPEALPSILAGCRLGVSATTMAVIAGEMLIGARHGLGRRIYDAQLLFRIPELYATVMVAALLGYALNLAVVLVERRTLHWVGR